MKKIQKGIALLCVLNAILAGILITGRSSHGYYYSDIEAEVLVSEDVEENTKKIALTFDDGPHAKYTPQLLDGLKERGVKATFFLIGKNIEGKEDIVKRISEEGHLIGNHTYGHVQLTGLSDTKACEEITKNSELIASITGKEVMYIRPPFGSWNKNLNCMINLTEIKWSIDPRDWDVKNTRTVVNHVVKHAKPGGIILLHDIYPTSVEAALEIVDELQKENYIFVTIDELENPEVKKTENETKSSSNGK